MKLTKVALSVSLVAASFTMAHANLLLNGNLDKVTNDPLPPNLPKPTSWMDSGNRAISGAFNDELSSETWAGPAPTPVTSDGPNGADNGVFFKAFAGSTANGALTAKLWQDVAGSAGMNYSLTGWAGGEANHKAESHWFSLVFLNASLSELSRVDLQLDATLLTSNGMAFNYKQYALNGDAPTGTAFVRSMVTMVNGTNNPLGGGQAFVVDDFDLNAKPVPEPATMAVLGLGGLAALARKRRAAR